MFDVIVIGAGIEGSATAYHLVKANVKTLLLEQFTLPHTRGSSHGYSRTIRRNYPQQHYAEMVGEAFKMWHTLEKETNTTLYRETGILAIEKADSPLEYVKNCIASLKATGADHEELTGEQLKTKYPMMRFDSDSVAVHDKQAGVLLADKCLHSLQKMYKHYGGALNDGERVIEIIPGSVVTIKTSAKKIYQAKRVIITAGPWTSKVVAPLGLNLPLKARQVLVCYWRQKKKLYSIEQGMCPLWVVDGSFYGIPALEHPNHMKICVHGGIDIDPDKPTATADSSKMKSLQQFVGTHFPGLENTPSIIDTCIYTDTPDEDFILDKHPEYNNIIIGAGFSGHGFKMAPVIGRILSQLALNETPQVNMTPFKISRFRNKDNMSKL